MSTTPLLSTITITIAAPQQTKSIPFATTPRFLSPFSGHHQLPVSSFFRRSSSSNNPPAPAPETQCPVPRGQQPINEYNSLSTSFPFSWAAGDPVEYASRLFALGASFTVLVGLPVAWFGTVGAESEPLERVLCGASSGILVVTLAVMRMYLGWAYVGNRLLSATVEYEETGWYDGQIWVKTAEILARDRLLGSFSVKPVLNRLKITLVSLGTSLLVFALILFNINGDQSYQSSKEIRDRVIPGVYSDESAKSFEPDAFCGEPDLQQ
ncbi:hypothetical protein HN51_017402 [Arachis hypogaea]|uniref:uncharacterized protein ycf36 n=1 Tax=Arachis ipaensis TaxID=130454 RepID=UPI0007AF5D56|nr:uncharacterized protein ycf36 [Arachis ipaensis]XP_025660046.1 protein CONSERVED IN THE GREEN LINEAGE AND DIATOMS 27, chloroplastic [Arachis hypogaea]QHN88752.1 uncharacterized protein DS421_16g566100 [Arachis hypogaea]